MTQEQDATHDPAERIRCELAEARDRLAQAEREGDAFCTGYWRARVKVLEARLLRLTAGRWEVDE